MTETRGDRLLWWSYTFAVLVPLFFVSVIYMSAGTFVYVLVGAVWGWSVTRWARDHRDRRRGWRVQARPTEAGIELRLWVYRPQAVAGVHVMVRRPPDSDHPNEERVDSP